MPTPVSAARQCLTEEAARALDDAVAVARRRSHAQTTSLHAVSALLALPSSSLREACARARSSAYSPRLQFRALELSVGVSLDRLPSAKSVEEPPVSNSLMAAIKRSQANQRRHPDNFHYQIIQSQTQQQQQTTSLLKVELKHFILSILDDPIVSRVFGEAGFRSTDIKLAIIHPPVSRFARTRCPPVFLCNLTDPDLTQRRSSFGFPGMEDENSRRIAEVLVRKSGKRNPLLLGVCAMDALRSFTERVKNGGENVLPSELSGLSVICIGNEISEFVNGGGSEEKMGLKLKEVGELQCLDERGGKVVVNFGDLKALVDYNDDSSEGGGVSFVVSRLSQLVELHGERLWLMGAAGSYETYSKFSGKFPSIEKDWDLNLLPITSSNKPSGDGFPYKSSLMGSFVPFGGFFPTSSDFTNPLSITNQSFTRCKQCTEKYEQEVAVIQKGGLTISGADQYSESIPRLQMSELDTGKGVDVAKTKDDSTTLNAKILGLQRKWNGTCQHLHQAQTFPKLDISHARSQVPSAEGLHFITNRKETSIDSTLNEGQCENPSPHMATDWQKLFPLKQNIQIPVASDAKNAKFQSELSVKVSKSQQIEVESPWLSTYSMPNMRLPPDRTSPSSITSVTTDLGLGTLYASTSQEPDSPKLPGCKDHLQHFSGSVSAEVDAVSESTSHQIVHSSSCSGPNMAGQADPTDPKSLRTFLAQKVCWQDDAICSISEAITRCRSGNRKRRGSGPIGDIWLTFLGPDIVGKRKIASALAEIMFGTRESLISVDLGSQDRVYQSDSMFEQHQELDGYNVKFRGKTVVDYIAEELSKKSHSVVFLQNVDKADFLAQSSLSQAIRTGKFADSHGREISINNMIFVVTSTVPKGDRTLFSNKEPVEFSEERILKAKRFQIKILNECVGRDASRSSGMNVRITRKGSSNPSSVNKRKLIDTCESLEQGETFKIQKCAHKVSKSFLDLNLPVEDMENVNCGDYDSDSISENSEAWLEEFFRNVDEKVDFKPFDFDALAGKIVKDISLQFQRMLGSEVKLEIDYEVMVQILAAAWLSDRKRAVEEWVEQVLSRSFAEAQQKYHLTAQSVLKLVTCEGLFAVEQAPGLGACLPARVHLN